MYEVGLDARDDIIDYFTLECERKLDIAIATRIYRISIIEAAVFRQMNVLIREVALILPQFRSNQLRRFDMEHSAIMRQRDMNIRA